ncbi:pimeloyl-ACP methyl ester carboxylesterase [Microbacterium trichothecenolyticum]|uniref:alpha/beta fold hydrolase n=1 Tax=Microbacterium trichothecenolyticum TaxID=69370 RepID=UPI002857C5A9|nr:alpha/beta hydrolase [Microbacterium trichothecenolyticum]MDR7186756.1 pimeloyl-ACP methyl ester carboxylesterase [Microbacterium trichothecenolyticum]
MPTAVTLPRLSWGSASADRRALLIHGLGSNGALMWRYGSALADAGWRTDAVDLRGHGTAPRTLDYTLAAYAADVAATGPVDAGPWDLVIGHSLGGAASVLAAAADPSWTRRLVLVDPALLLTDHDRDIVRDSQTRSFDDPSQAAVRAEHPHWHPHDIELKALSAQQASRWAVEQTSAQNAEWDVTDAALRIAVPTHVIASDPGVYSIFRGKPAEATVAPNPNFTVSVVADAGHSPHRDQPESTIEALFAALA